MKNHSYLGNHIESRRLFYYIQISIVKKKHNIFMKRDKYENLFSIRTECARLNRDKAWNKAEDK